MGIPRGEPGPERAKPPRRLHAVPDPPTLDAVYRDHVDFVVRVTRQLGVPPAQVEDVVHDVFLVVHKKLDDFEPRAPIRSWLFGITKRIVLHQQRTARRASRREQHAPAPSERPDPEARAVSRQAADVVEACLRELPPEQRIAFVLADVEDTPVPEIARMLGVKLNTVYSRLRLARRRLELALTAWREEDA